MPGPKDVEMFHYTVISTAKKVLFYGIGFLFVSRLNQKVIDEFLMKHYREVWYHAGSALVRNRFTLTLRIGGGALYAVYAKAYTVFLCVC